MLTSEMLRAQCVFMHISAHSTHTTHMNRMHTYYVGFLGSSKSGTTILGVKAYVIDLDCSP